MIVVPKAFTAAEQNPTLARWATGLAKKYSPRKMDPLFAAVSFGWGLLALGRKAEAKALMGEVVEPVVFDGNFNVWTPVANGLCLLARLSTPARKKKLIGRLVAHPALAVMEEDRLLTWVEKDVRDLTALIDDPKAKADRIAHALQRVGYFEQTTGHGFSYDQWLDAAGLTSVIDAGLTALKTRLQR